MSAIEMLLKAGYSVQEAERISGQKAPIPRRPTQAEIAAANEAKYANVGMSAEERIMYRINDGRKRVFSDIGNRLVCGVGDCHSNSAVNRRVKYGKGNMSKRGFLKRPLEESV